MEGGGWRVEGGGKWCDLVGDILVQEADTLKSGRKPSSIIIDELIDRKHDSIFVRQAHHASLITAHRVPLRCFAG